MIVDFFEVPTRSGELTIITFLPDQSGRTMLGANVHASNSRFSRFRRSPGTLRLRWLATPEYSDKPTRS